MYVEEVVRKVETQGSVGWDGSFFEDAGAGAGGSCQFWKRLMRWVISLSSRGAGGLLVEGSELVGDVLEAFVLEPAGYAVEGAVAVTGCVVVLHVGLNGFVELSGGFLCVGGLSVLFFLLTFFCCVIVG